MSSSQRLRRRLSVHIPDRKHVDFEQPSQLNAGNLSPDLQPATPPTYPQHEEQCSPVPQLSQIGNYVLVQQTDVVGEVQYFRAFHCDSQEEFLCKVIPSDKYRQTLEPYWRVGSHNHINEVAEILLGSTKAYVFFARHYGDLHSYVRRKRRLREAEAGRLFSQIIQAISHCHANGVVLRDLKLRKFVFKDAERSELKLESLEDAIVLDKDEDDQLADKHGCPAYVSPEILAAASHSYSGRSADMWSAGVMLYTMLIGRYPFHDVEPTALFGKIRRGEYRIPESVSSRARCLIRCLLRKEPEQRQSADEIISHPWFKYGSRIYGGSTGSAASSSGISGGKTPENADQFVPQISVDCPQDALFV